ncbi:hypothetical protein [Xanthocytophaga agilis]|uniref:Uncharacterized protein n=1 Tax=Xanthocytophaga agilis TaxID=3048010 RepID=A0AAE3RC77_9BACT|nr:hypothetical protein [Xanthocytophaga agilis]MDJ1505737.1 hypothetical protein [Xanthocytophaga agilis]
MSKDEFWLMQPDGIPEEIIKTVRNYPCYGVSFESSEGPLNLRTFSPTIAALYVCQGISDAFYNSEGKEFPLNEVLITYWNAYEKGYKECKELLENKYLAEIEKKVPAEIITKIYNLGREWKRECYFPIPVSERSIYNVGYNTGRTVVLAEVVHEKGEWFKLAFGCELSCSPDRPIFENFKPLDQNTYFRIGPAGVDKDGMRKLKKAIGIIPENGIEIEKNNLSFAAFHKHFELLSGQAKNIGIQNALKFNRTTGKHIEKELDEHQYADFYSKSHVKNNFKITLTFDKLNNKVQAQFRFDVNYNPLPYIDFNEFKNYDTYLKDGYSADNYSKIASANAQDIIINKSKIPKMIKEFDSFDELFYNSQEIKPCIDALKNIRVGKNENRRTGIISSNETWIEKKPNKSVLLAWVAVLRKKSKIKTINDQKLSRLLEKRFPGLSLSKDASNFRTITTAENEYTPDFESVIK